MFEEVILILLCLKFNKIESKIQVTCFEIFSPSMATFMFWLPKESLSCFFSSKKIFFQSSLNTYRSVWWHRVRQKICFFRVTKDCELRFNENIFRELLTWNNNLRKITDYNKIALFISQMTTINWKRGLLKSTEQMQINVKISTSKTINDQCSGCKFTQNSPSHLRFPQ